MSSTRSATKVGRGGASGQMSSTRSATKVNECPLLACIKVNSLRCCCCFVVKMVSVMSLF